MGVISLRNTIVIKFGGSMMDDLSNEFFDGIKKLIEHGYKPILVHGGGPAINTMLKKLSIQSEFINGLRKTTSEVMEVVEMVLTGSISKKLVRTLQQQGIPAIGLSGSDGELLYAKAIDEENLGFVGEITEVNEQLLFNLLTMGFVPVISPIAMGDDKKTYYNVNADSAAASIALAVGANKIIFVTDVPGILVNDELLEKTTKAEIHRYIENGVITGGMIPKVTAAMKCLEGGLKEVLIVSGKQPLFTGVQFLGTTIQKE